jgi:DNA adenine methylase
VKPPFPYYGGKQMLADRIVALLPEHRHYVEPYAGGLSVLLAKPPSPIETVNDLDSALITFWRVLRDREAELMRLVELTPHARAENDLCRTVAVIDDELETARRVWVRLTQGRGSNPGDDKTGWRYAANPDYGSAARHLSGYRSRMPICAWRLAHVSLECRPAVEVIAEYGQHLDVLLYVDPPYVESTRTSAGKYTHEMTDGDHRQLADALHGSAAAVVLSGYPSPLYDELYSDWKRVDLSGYTNNGMRGKGTTEVLWSNRPLGNQPDLFAHFDDLRVLEG